MPRCVWFTPGADRQTPAPTRMLPSVIGGRHAVLRLGIFRSMNQLVSWNRRRFPLGHGPFANDTFCKTTGGLATLRKRHGIQCATMGTKEGTSRRDFPVNGMGRLRSFKANCTPGKECVREQNWIQLAHVAERHRRARWKSTYYSMTLSARASTEGGTARLSALAVFRLTMNSNFVGCSTGKSAGLAPFNILST